MIVLYIHIIVFRESHMKRTILLSIACLSIPTCKSNDQLKQKPVIIINANDFLQMLRTSLLQGHIPKIHMHRFTD